VDRGNASDSIQFVKIVDDIIGDLRDDSMFVFDAGGDAKQVLDRITEKNMRYITRKRLNITDDAWIIWNGECYAIVKLSNRAKPPFMSSKCRGQVLWETCTYITRIEGFRDGASLSDYKY